MSFAAESFAADTAPIIFGCTGHALDADEKAFFRAARPAGFILFQKNCDNPAQVARLCAELRDCAGWDAPILIDQEGGRVQRLKTPGWTAKFPPMRPFGELYKRNPAAALAAIETNVRALAAQQCPMGVDVDCIPVLDVVPDENKVRAIDDRAFGSDPEAVAALGLAAVNAALDAGMTPVIKHIPGHGRATVDSHHDLPRIDAPRAVLEASDFKPFAHVAANVAANAGGARVWGMSAHVVYTHIDPDLPATLSSAVIGGIVRDTLGFGGLLLTDDLFMDALAPFGDVPERARLALAAGIDIALHCHGDVPARARAVERAGPMAPETAARLSAWLAKRPVFTPANPPANPVDSLLSQVTASIAGC